MSKKVIQTNEYAGMMKESAVKKIIKTVIIFTLIHMTVNTLSKILNRMNQVKTNASDDGVILKCKEIFNGRNIKIDKKVFKGAIIKDICSGIKLDLTDAIIAEDVDIKCKNIMSGISIIVPENVNVEFSDKSILSGVANHVPTLKEEGLPTIHIYTKNIMSGVEVKVKNPDEDNNAEGANSENQSEMKQEMEEE